MDEFFKRKTSSLNPSDPVDGSEILHVVQNGKSRITTINAIVSKAIASLSTTIAAIYQAISEKETSVPGKGLSTEDFSTSEKNKLAGIQPGAQVNPDLSSYATTEALSSGLAGKASSSHGHAMAGVTGLEEALGGKVNHAASATGTAIDFTTDKVFGSVATPETGNITASLTAAKIGIVQKIYHNAGTAPTFPAGFVKLGAGTYTVSTLNVIYCEWVSGTRVEYWITQ